MAAKKFLFVAVAYTAIITFLSLIQLGKISLGSFSPTDKMMHAGAYLGLGFVWMFYYLLLKPDDFPKKKPFLTISVLVIVFGMLIEVLQGTLTDYRQPDWADILANSIGVLIALSFCVYFQEFLIRLKHKISLFL